MRSSTFRVWAGAVAVTYIALVLGGLTTSSLGVERLSETRSRVASGVVAGTPRSIRSDEFLRSTPWVLGLLERGSDDFASPLAYPDVALVAPTVRDVSSALLHWEAVAFAFGGALPDSMLFAAVWWLPVALVAILLPFWLMRLGVMPGIAVSATGLVLLAPANHWWSWGPVGVLAAPLLAAVLALGGLDRWRDRGRNAVSLGAFALAALCVAKAALGYAPWSIPLSAAVFVPTLAAVLVPGSRRLGLACLGGTFVAGIVLVVILVAPSGAVDVIAGTVYPGARRSVGEFVGWGLLFGAPHLWILQAAPEIARSTNESELAGGYFVVVLPCVLLGGFGIRWGDVGTLRRSALAAGGVTAVFTSWAAVDWPHVLADRAVPLTLVPPDRMAEVLGLIATITFAFVLSAWALAPRRGRSGMALGSAALVGAFTVIGGRALREEALPTLPTAGIVVIAGIIALAIGLMAWRPHVPLALALPPILAVLVVFAANPLQQGLGDLRSSAAASAARAASVTLGSDRYWASDDPAFDALLMANGAQALSGQQWVGPREAAWRVLDPAGAGRQIWNRGASFIVFRWAPGATTRITASARDVIQVRTDPCAPRLQRLGLELVGSRRPLTADCLTSRGRFRWGYQQLWVYSVSPVPP